MCWAQNKEAGRNAVINDKKTRSKYPNISGNLNNTVYASDHNATSGFYTVATGSLGIGSGVSTAYVGVWHVGFNANLSNGYYGKANVIQPLSFRRLTIVRT